MKVEQLCNGEYIANCDIFSKSIGSRGPKMITWKGITRWFVDKMEEIDTKEEMRGEDSERNGEENKILYTNSILPDK